MPRQRSELLDVPVAKVVPERSKLVMPPSSPPIPRLLDCRGRLSRVLVLPDSNDKPSDGSQCGIVATVTIDIALELVAPPSGVGLRSYRVPCTAVPEAAIDEDCNFGASEGNVRTTGEISDTDPITESSPMELSSQCKFWFRVSGSKRRHESLNGWSRCCRSWYGASGRGWHG